MGAKTIANDTARKPGDVVAYPVAASASKIWKGAPVFVNSSGYAYSNDGTTNTLANGDMFVGWADDTVESTSANGGAYIKVRATGTVVVLIAATAAQTDVGQNVFVNNNTDNALVSLTSHASNPQVTVGQILEIIDATHVRINTNGVYTVAANGA